MRRARSAPSRGFTLVEIMIVLAIFAVLAVMAYGGLASVLTAREHIAASLGRTAELQKAFLALRNDFQQVRARPVRDNFGDPAPLPALLLNRDGAVEFTRSGWRNPLSAPRSALQRVRYRLDQEHQLVRGYWRVLDRAPQSEPLETAVLTQVESVDWRFMDRNAEWHTTWPDSAATGVQAVDPPPPRAVEISLHLTDLGAVRLLFSATNVAPQLPPLPLPNPGGGG